MFNRHLLLERIRQIQEEGRTGLLSLEKDRKVILIFFRNGLIDALSSDISHHGLGQYLLREGFISAADVTPLVEEARKRHVPLGEAAVRGKALDPVDLVDVLRQQAFQLFKHAVEDDFAPGSFDASSPTFSFPARIDLEYLLLQMARYDPKPVELDMDRLLVLKEGKELSHLPWYPQELSVLNELKHPRTVHNLATATGLEYIHLKKILNVLHNLQLIESLDTVANETTTALTLRERFPFEFLIPELRNVPYSPKLEVLHNDSSFVSEQFKTLKIRLSEVPSDKPVKVITVSSAQTEDGKSLVSANLALCLSKDVGRRVLIIDCDLRNPSLHKYVGSSLEPGLMGYLQNGHLHPHCYMRRLDKLYIMTAGGVAPNPVELLSLGKMRELIKYLKTEFDTILLDATPMVPVSDARVLAGLSDGVIMVARRGKTSCSSLERAFKVLDLKKLMGVVFNDVKPMLFHTHYDSAYYKYGQQKLYPGATKRIKNRTKTYLED